MNITVHDQNWSVGDSSKSSGGKNSKLFLAMSPS